MELDNSQQQNISSSHDVDKSSSLLKHRTTHTPSLYYTPVCYKHICDICVTIYPVSPTINPYCLCYYCPLSLMLSLLVYCVEALTSCVLCGSTVMSSIVISLPVKVTYKLGVMVYRCLHSQAPRYLANHLITASVITSRLRLRSVNRHQLIIPRRRQ